MIYELWWEQLLLDDRLRFKIGKVDANTEFAFVDAAADFANSSAGFSPTIVGFPSYPDPATSINLFARLFENERAGFTLKYGFYDGAAGVDGVPTGTRGPSTFLSDDLSNDYFHIAEAELDWNFLRTPDDRWLRAGRIAVGVWHHTGDFERFDEGFEDGTTGVYLTFEQRLLARDPADLEGDSGLHLFAQYGWADEDVSDFEQHFAAGLVLRGTFTTRDNDAAGVYVSLADLSDNPDAGYEDDELVIDAYYRAQVTGSVFVQPELQYIVDPSGNPATPDALVVGVRVGIAF